MYSSMKRSLIDTKRMCDSAFSTEKKFQGGAPCDPTSDIENLSKNKIPPLFLTIDFPAEAPRKRRNVSSLVTYFTLAYYLGIVPYKPCFTESEGWKLKKSRLQQVMSIICVWIPFWFGWITKIPLFLIAFLRGRKGKITALSYFLLLRLTLNYAKMSNYFWVFVGNRKNVCKLEQLLNQDVLGGHSLFDRSNYNNTEHEMTKAEQVAAKFKVGILPKNNNLQKLKYYLIFFFNFRDEDWHI